MPQAHRGNPQRRLQDYSSAHLRLAYTPVPKRDRDLRDAKPRPDRAVGRLDLEGVTRGGDRVELDGLEDLAAERLEAARQVADADAEERPRVGAAAAADGPPQRSPVG